MAGNSTHHTSIRSAAATAAKRRNSAKRAKKAAQSRAVTYEPGHFTALLWPTKNWPYAGWTPMQWTQRQSGVSASRNATAQRDAQMAAGNFYATGTVVMPGTPKNLAPGWLEQIKQQSKGKRSARQ